MRLKKQESIIIKKSDNQNSAIADTDKHKQAHITEIYNINDEELLHDSEFLIHAESQSQRETRKGIKKGGGTLGFDEDFSCFGTGHVEFFNGKWLIGLPKHSCPHVGGQISSRCRSL